MKTKILPLLCIAFNLGAQLLLLQFSYDLTVPLGQLIERLHSELPLPSVMAINLFSRFNQILLALLIGLACTSAFKVLKPSTVSSSTAIWPMLQLSLGIFLFSFLAWGILGLSQSTVLRDAGITIENLHPE